MGKHNSVPKITAVEAKTLLQDEPDFVYTKRYAYSLEKMLERYPDGAPAKVAAASLMLTEEEYEEAYQLIIKKLRHFMGIREEDK